MEEESKDKAPCTEYHPVLKYYEDVFREILGLPPKRDVDFSINLMPRVSPMSKNPYKMITIEFKELHMHIEIF